MMKCETGRTRLRRPVSRVVVRFSFYGVTTTEAKVVVESTLSGLMMAVPGIDVTVPVLPELTSTLQVVASGVVVLHRSPEYTT